MWSQWKKRVLMQVNMRLSAAAWCSFIRWTCYNSVFLLFWVHAHNAIPWHHEFGAPRHAWRWQGMKCQTFWLCLFCTAHGCFHCCQRYPGGGCLEV